MNAVTRSLAGALLALALTPVAQASLDGSAAKMVIPLVVESTTFSSQVTLFNPDAAVAIHIAVVYSGAPGTAAPGIIDCGTQTLAPEETRSISPGVLCVLPKGSYGSLYLQETSASVVKSFHAYSRVQNYLGSGFSVPGTPWGAFEHPFNVHRVIGLKRQAAAPGYQTNCFVAATDDTTPYRIRLFDAGGAQVGSDVSGTLGPFEMKRFLDIFAHAGLAAGDWSNARAEFSAGFAGAQTLVAFCTVQDNTSFGADYRIAMPTQPADDSRLRSANGPLTIPRIDARVRMPLFLRAPDRVRCFVGAPVAGALELRLLDPDLAPVAGGPDVADSGVVTIGPRSVYPTDREWFLDVKPSASFHGPYPINGTVVCFAGQGLGFRVNPEASDDVLYDQSQRTVSSAQDMSLGADDFSNCQASEGCFGNAGLVVGPGGAMPASFTFTFTVDSLRKAAIMTRRGSGRLTVTAARDIGHRVGEPATESITATIDGIALGSLFTDNLSDCPLGERGVAYPAALVCGPNFHTDVRATETRTLPQETFRSAAADNTITVVLSPTAAVGRLKIFEVRLQYVALP